MELNCKAHVGDVQPCYNSELNMTSMKFVLAHSELENFSVLFRLQKSYEQTLCQTFERFMQH